MLGNPTTSHLEAATKPFSDMPLSLQPRPSTTFQPRKLQWVTNEITQRYIADCQKRTDKIIADSDTIVLYFDEYGTDFAKRVGAYWLLVIS